jgi:hypothetical protein
MGIESAAHITVRFRGETLKQLDAESYRKARDDLRSYIAKGGLTLVRSGRPWSKSKIHSGDQAKAAWDLVGRLAQETCQMPCARLVLRRRRAGQSNPRP